VPIRHPLVFALRLLHVNLGLAGYGLGVALMLSAGVGLGPWDVFHEGVALRTPLSVGQAMILAGMVVLLISMRAAKVRPGLATLLNILLIGTWADVFLALPDFPTARGWVDGGIEFALGVALCGASTGLYLTAGLGAGPRDGFSLALAKLFGITVRRARTLVELGVLASGWALGGTVGWGTLGFALAIGPLMQLSLRLFAPLERAYTQAEATAAATVRGR
jgi:uncharacterized membrane protein YczE